MTTINTRRSRALALLLSKAEPWVCRDVSITPSIRLTSLGPCLGPSRHAWPYPPCVGRVVGLEAPSVVPSSLSASWPLPQREGSCRCGALPCPPVSPDDFHPPGTQGGNQGENKSNVHKAPVSASVSWQPLPALSAFKRDCLQFLSSFCSSGYLNMQALSLCFWAA